MNEYIRAILINKIQHSLKESTIAIYMEHPYLTGKLREIFLSNLIKPLLNNNYSTGTGKVIDYNGAKSNEIDICIYSKNLHPPFFFSEKDDLGIFPIESVLKCIEVKSLFNGSTLEDAFKRFEYLENSLQHTSGFHDCKDMPLPQVYVKQKYDFFAFKSEALKYNAESILKIYSKIDSKWNSEPLITSICVANKGWLCYIGRGWYHMAYNKKQDVNEEIIGYLSTLLQDLYHIEKSRGNPRIGYYLFDAFQMDKIINGKKIENTWRNNKVTFTSASIG